MATADAIRRCEDCGKTFTGHHSMVCPHDPKPAPMNLTPKQRELLQVIADYRAARGISPTQREIAKILEVTNVTIWERCQACILAGCLTKSPGSRGLTLTTAAAAQIQPSRDLRWKVAGTLSAKGITWNFGKATPIQETA